MKLRSATAKLSSTEKDGNKENIPPSPQNLPKDSSTNCIRTPPPTQYNETTDLFGPPSPAGHMDILATFADPPNDPPPDGLFALAQAASSHSLCLPGFHNEDDDNDCSSMPGLAMRDDDSDDELSDDEDDQFPTGPAPPSSQPPNSVPNPYAPLPFNTVVPPNPVPNPYAPQLPSTNTVTPPTNNTEVPPGNPNHSLFEIASALRTIELKEMEGGRMVSGGAVAQAAASTNNVPSYSGAKKKIVNDFIESLRKMSPKYNHLLERTSEIPCSFRIKSKEVEKVFVLLSGPNDKTAKVNLLNKLLIDWVGNLEIKRGAAAATSKNTNNKKRKRHHQPSSINTMTRRFFAACKGAFDWHFTTNDFTFDGGYNGFFRDLCDKRLTEDVSQPHFCFLF